MVMLKLRRTYERNVARSSGDHRYCTIINDSPTQLFLRFASSLRQRTIYPGLTGIEVEDAASKAAQTAQIWLFVYSLRCVLYDSCLVHDISWRRSVVSKNIRKPRSSLSQNIKVWTLSFVTMNLNDSC
ncbi:hypothetical protein AB6A40_006516 [Gnathostoma spinigerum]|uniref:Uncharacterized protein n=1 Tax=Gnathostoma spinigerum TaxID=75299 RepID=A0ABD6ETD6_9BILA